MAPAIVLASASASRPAVTITEPSSPPPRPATSPPPRLDALHPSSARRARSPSPAPRPRSPPPGPAAPAPAPRHPPRSPLALPLPGQSPLQGGNIGCPDCLAGPGVSVPFSPPLTATEEARLVDVVMNGPSPTNMAVVAREMGWETPGYWGQRITEIRAKWPAAFQEVVDRRGDAGLREEDEEAKQRLDKFFFK